MLINIINELIVEDITKSIEFYTKYLEFKIIETMGNPIKTETSNLIKFKYNNEEIVSNLYKILKSNNAKIFIERHKTEYNSLEFGIYDPDRNMLIIST